MNSRKHRAAGRLLFLVFDGGSVGFSSFDARIFRALKEPGKVQEALKILTELMTVSMIVFDKSKKYG